MDGAERFQDLIAWQLLDALEREVWQLAKRPGLAGDFKLRSQITDAAGSATRNCSEGFARYNPGEFARFLDISRASATEVRNCLISATTAGYISAAEMEPIDRLARRALGAVAGLQRYLRSEAARRNAKRFRYARGE
jgi:four helix bundle protein